MIRPRSDIHALTLAVVIQTGLLLLLEPHISALHQEVLAQVSAHASGALVRVLLFAAYALISLSGLATFELTRPAPTPSRGLRR